MRSKWFVVTLLAVAVGFEAHAFGQRGRERSASAPDPIATVVGRLDLERYKATIKGLTQFGDRLQGTDRNRRALDWIEAQLRSYGCADVQRLHYVYDPAPRPLQSGRGAGS